MIQRQHYITIFFLLHGIFCYAQVPNIKKTYREQAFLHTDRNCYLAGETIWMKMYTVNDDSTDGFNSAIGYIDLYNEKTGRLVTQEKILLDTVAMSSGNLTVPDTLPTGTYRIRAYTRNMEQYGLFYQKNIHVINTLRPVPNLKTTPHHLPAAVNASFESPPGGDRYGRRQAVTISFSSFAGNQQPTTANMSAAVFRYDDLAMLDSPDIRSLAIPTESPYLAKEESHIPEAYRQMLTGTVMDKKTGLPLDVPVMVTVTGRIPRFYCEPSEKGRFAIELQGYSGDANIIAQALVKDHKDYLITLNSPYTSFYPPKTVHEFFDDAGNMDSTLSTTLLNHHVNAQVWQAYYADSIQQLPDRFGDTTFFFHKPDEVVLLDDYTRFNTVEEVFREFVKTVMVRKFNDTLHLRTLNNRLTNPKFFDEDPLILLDGVPVVDNKRLFALDPFKIRKVSVMARRFFYPGQSFNGIVSMQTYTGDMAGYKLDPNAVVADYSGTQVPLQFYAPDYAVKNIPSMPDQRTTLYWNPMIRTDAAGHGTFRFYTGDEPGTYCIVLQGLTTQGTPCYTVKTFTVE